jgi:TolB-like protein
MARCKWVGMAMCLAVLGAGPVKEKVLIMPFAPVDPNSNQVWIGRAVGQNLMTDFSRSPLLTPISPGAVQATDDLAAAVKAGKESGARYVIFGSFQGESANLRITGQIIDMKTEQPIAGLRATGMMRDLFALEDTIADEARRVLPHPQVDNPPAPAQAQAPVQQQPMVSMRGFEGSDLQQSTLAGPYSGNVYADRYQYLEPVWPYYGYGYGYRYGYGYNPYYYSSYYNGLSYGVWDADPPSAVTVVNVNNDSGRGREHHRESHVDPHQINVPPQAPITAPAPVAAAQGVAPLDAWTSPHQTAHHDPNDPGTISAPNRPGSSTPR